MGKTYTLADLHREHKIFKADGTPYEDIGAIRGRLKELGIKRTKLNDKGVRIYSITDKDIQLINKGRTV